MKQFTKSEFAAIIRSKYPGSYDDLSDSKLISLWVKKYPKDKEKINFTEEESTGIFTYILYTFAIWFVLTLINNNFKKIDFVDHFNRNLFKSKSTVSNSQNSTEQKIQAVDTARRISNQNNTENSIPTEPQVDNSVSEPQNNEVNNQSESKTYTCLLCEGRGFSVCSTCKGKGSKLCRWCNGLGYITEKYDGRQHGCSACLNSGLEECEKYTKCPSIWIGCGGSGFVDKEKHAEQVRLYKLEENMFKEK